MAIRLGHAPSKIWGSDGPLIRVEVVTSIYNVGQNILTHKSNERVNAASIFYSPTRFALALLSRKGKRESNRQFWELKSSNSSQSLSSNNIRDLNILAIMVLMELKFRHTPAILDTPKPNPILFWFLGRQS
ncbi:unnamed protein product [Dovyalis caffra]|uniref:Uncharacterized protein n=1 Tax=Dovyalis caffra TaxID=77055 RepID=A0AAV1SFQ6_9ROSI|nr:unnamed protein product [Dovyalis caffra]